MQHRNLEYVNCAIANKAEEETQTLRTQREILEMVNQMERDILMEKDFEVQIKKVNEAMTDIEQLKSGMKMEEWALLEEMINDRLSDMTSYVDSKLRQNELKKQAQSIRNIQN